MAPPRNRGPGFSRRAQYGRFLGYVLAVACALIGAGFIVASRYDPPPFALLRSGARELTAPVSGILARGARTIGAVPTAIGTWWGVHGENARLREQLAAEHRLLTRARGLAYQNRRLRRLLTLRDGNARTIAAARLVSSSASSGRRFAVLYAGRWQGVEPGMAVEGPEGLIGRVLEAGPNAARILLLSDAESIVPVRRARDGLAAFAAGRGDGAIDIRAVNLTNAVLRPGDVFVSTGTGGLFPPDIPVARIVRPARDTAPARPLADPSLFDVALVLAPFVPAAAPPPAAAVPIDAAPVAPVSAP